MNKIIVSFATLALFGAMSAVQAAPDAAAGAKLFSSNCGMCHANGGNIANAEKTLKKDSLEKSKMLSAAAIVAQVTKGSGGMPGFDKKLTAAEIENVAAYVLEQAKKDWK